MKKLIFIITLILVQNFQSQTKDSVSKESKIQEVVLEGKKPLIERKADRLIFNVENSIATSGGTALDALKATPNVKINNDEITIVGKSSVMVLINDKEVFMTGDQLARYLEGISASDLSKIEVITTPPVKYSAEGNSGIINIVTKKIKENSWNTDLGASYQKSRRNTERDNLGYNIQKNKVTLQTSLGFGDRRFLRNWNSDLFYPENKWENRGITDYITKYYVAKVALDYKINKKLTIGTKLNSSYYKSSDQSPSDSNIFDSQTGNLQKIISEKSIAKDKNSQQNYNLYSEYKIGSLGRKITMDLDFVNYKLPGNRNFSYGSYLPNQALIEGTDFTGLNNTQTNIQNLSAKINAEFPLKLVNLSFGARYSDTKSVNSIAAFKKIDNGFVPDLDITNYFQYKEKNEALYFSGSKKLGKWDLQAGLRMEATQTNGFSRENNETDKSNYVKLFPTLYAMYAFNPKTTLGLNYSRRINRPNYENLNPFRIISNYFSYNEGNAFLKPSFTNNVELTFTLKNLDSRLFYSSTKNGISQASLINPATMQNNFVWMNYLNTDSYGLAETYTLKVSKWWTSLNTLNISYSKTILTISPQIYKGLTADFSSSNDFTLNKDKTAFFNLSFSQDFGGNSGNFTSTAFSTVDVSFKYLTFNKKLQVGISGSNIFNGIGSAYQTMNGVKQNFRNIWDNQSFRISLNYKFGNDKITLKERKTGNSEDLDRL
jgi:outer membrane receptor protein involved in Fe transport